jgi:hypothetical protein
MCVPTCTYVALVLHLIVRCMEPHPAALGFLGTAVVEVAAFARLALVARRHRLHVTPRRYLAPTLPVVLNSPLLFQIQLF